MTFSGCIKSKSGSTKQHYYPSTLSLMPTTLLHSSLLKTARSVLPMFICANPHESLLFFKIIHFRYNLLPILYTSPSDKYHFRTLIED